MLKKNALINEIFIVEEIFKKDKFKSIEIYNSLKEKVHIKDKISKIDTLLPSGQDNILKNRIRWIIFRLKKEKKIKKVMGERGLYKVIKKI
jgi:restriction endonuclease Mrr